MFVVTQIRFLNIERTTNSPKTKPREDLDRRQLQTTIQIIGSRRQWRKISAKCVLHVKRLFELGGEEAAAQVHGEPWPLEQLDRSAVPEDLLHTVDEIDALLAVACAQLQFDEEHLTIARRLLTRLAQHDPKALRRPAATGGWVAGLIVAVGDLNGLIGQSRGRVTKKAIAAAAGVKSVGSKDMTVGRGARLSTKYHHVDLLDSRNRTELLELLAEST